MLGPLSLPAGSRAAPPVPGLYWSPAHLGSGPYGLYRPCGSHHSQCQALVAPMASIGPCGSQYPPVPGPSSFYRPLRFPAPPAPGLCSPYGLYKPLRLPQPTVPGLYSPYRLLRLPPLPVPGPCGFYRPPLPPAPPVPGPYSPRA